MPEQLTAIEQKIAMQQTAINAQQRQIADLKQAIAELKHIAALDKR